MIIVLKPQSTKQMVDNFVDSLQKNYDVKVNEWVGTQSTVLGLIGDTSAIDIDYISAQDIVENLLLANPDPDSITAIWAAWDEPAIGATQALQEAGRSQVLVTGVDGNEQAISLVKEGTNLKATVKQNFEGMAQIVYEQMDRYFKGEEIEKGEMYAPATLITQENADAQ